MTTRTSEPTTAPGVPTPAGLRRRVERVVAPVNRSLARGLTWPMERQVRALGKRGTITLPEVLAFRAGAEAYLARSMFRAAPGTRVERVKVTVGDGAGGAGQVRGEWVERGAPTRHDAVVYYVHGGAFVAFSPRTHRGMVSEIAARTERSVFSLDYRLAPEHRFPAAADDVLRGYRHLLDSGVRAEHIVVAGDSAGGHLALGLTPRAVRAGLPAPGAVVALSPVVDASMNWSVACEERLRPGREPVSAQAGVAAIGAYTLGTPTDDRELLLTADDLSVMPPTLLQVSEHEMLYDDSARYVEALTAAGVSGELQTWQHKDHVFQIGWKASRSASAALDKVAAFVVAHG